LETSQVQKGSARLQINREIDIALFVGSAAGYRSEDTHVAGAAPYPAHTFRISSRFAFTSSSSVIARLL
jgi:hypothetical protein